MLNIYILTQQETLKIGHEQHFDQSQHTMHTTRRAFHVIKQK